MMSETTAQDKSLGVATNRFLSPAPVGSVHADFPRATSRKQFRSPRRQEPEAAGEQQERWPANGDSRNDRIQGAPNSAHTSRFVLPRQLRNPSPAGEAQQRDTSLPVSGSCSPAASFNTPPSPSELSHETAEAGMAKIMSGPRLMLEKLAGQHAARPHRNAGSSLSSYSADEHQSSGDQAHSNESLSGSGKPTHYTRTPSPKSSFRPTPEAEGNVKGLTKNGLVDDGGLLVDPESLILGASQTLNVFRGALLVLMAIAQVISWMCTKQSRVSSSAGLMLCNFASTLCMEGILFAFGFACYENHFRSWHGAPENKFEFVRAGGILVACAWICNFAWAFVGAKVDPTTDAMRQLVFFEATRGCGTDVLLACFVNFCLVYALWRPIKRTLSLCKIGDEIGWRRDFLAVIAALLPGLVFASGILPTYALCNLHPTLRGAFVCGSAEQERVSQGLETTVDVFESSGSFRADHPPRLPALPHLLHFNLGVVVAACWNRILGELRPFGIAASGEEINEETARPRDRSLSVLPWARVQHWASLLLGASLLAVAFYVPLGQLFLYEDLVHASLPTPLGQLEHGYAGGPSILWLLATLWPLGTTFAITAIVVAIMHSPSIGPLLRMPMVELEHLGVNALFYIVVIDVGTASMFRGHERFNPEPFNVEQSLLGAFAILAVGHFLLLLARSNHR